LSSTAEPARREPSPTDRSAELRRRRAARVTASLLVVVVAFAGAYVVNHSSAKHRNQHRSGRKGSRAAAACGAQPPSPHTAPHWQHPPPLTVDPHTDYRAVIATSCGDIKIDLLEKTAPQTVANFVFLARHGFYDGRRWFRVENDSVIETGDPNDHNGVPPDGPGYTIPDELPNKARVYVYGVVAMANAGQPNSGGSQFFIVIHHDEPAGYDPRYSIFGKVDPSSDGVLEKIGAQKTFGGSDPIKSVTPITPVFINSVQILMGTGSAGGA
jgi:cyclophilin family peptidyl-prolyl cis-trans isomerase